MHVAVAAVVTCGTAASAQRLPGYESIVAQYADGDAVGAVKLLTPSSARLTSDIVERMRQLPARQVRSAVMLHTELAAAFLAAGRLSAAATQIGNAQRLLGILTGDARARTSSQTFAVRWFAFTTNLYTSLGPSDVAYRIVRDGLTLFPGSAELYVARGNVHEMRATLAERLFLGDGYKDPRPRLRPLLEAAAEDFRRAISADDTLATSRLHLGVVHYWLGDRQASRDLETAVKTAADDGVRYLAHLFLGAVAERKRDLEDARREFEVAMAVALCQSSYVALSRIEAELAPKCGRQLK